MILKNHIELNDKLAYRAILTGFGAKRKLILKKRSFPEHLCLGELLLGPWMFNFLMSLFEVKTFIEWALIVMAFGTDFFVWFN